MRTDEFVSGFSINFVALMCVTTPEGIFHISLPTCEKMDDFLALLSRDKAREKFIVFQVVLFDVDYLILNF